VAEGKTIYESRATSVTLFEDRATVTRAAQVKTDGKDGWARISGFSPLLSDRSIRVKPAGSGREVLSVRVRRVIDYVSSSSDEDVAGLDKEAIEAKNTAKLDQLAISRHTHSRNRLSTLYSQWAEAISRLNWAREDDSIHEWDEAYRQIGEAMQDAIEGQESAHVDLDGANDQLRSATRRLELARRREPVCRAIVEVQLSGSPELPSDLEIDYTVPCALWRPEHRVQATDGVLEWTVSATSWQLTGENWKDVALSFSTARLSKASAAPLLVEDRVKIREKTEQEKKVVTVSLRDEEVKLAGKQDAHRSVDEMPGVDDGGVPLTFSAPTVISLPSDGEPHRIELYRLSLPAKIKRVLMAEMTPIAHFVAESTLDDDRPLLAGPMVVSRSASMVGRSRMSFVGAGEGFEIGLGPDDGVRIKREQKEKPSRKAISGTQIIDREVTLYLANLSDVEREFEVVERIPVSEVEQVEIELEDSEGWSFDAKDGFLKKQVTVGGNDRAETGYSYQLRAKSNVQLPF